MSRKIFPIVTLLLSGCFVLSAQANDAALYGPAAPKGSAFVRLYNAGSQDVDANIGNIHLETTTPQDSSDFSFLPNGSHSAKIGEQSITVQLEPEHYYTLVNLPGKQLTLVEDPPFKGRQKALLRVQNLSDVSLTLKTADGKTIVVENVAPQGHGDREINPVKVNLALFDGERKVVDLPAVALERGEVTCLFVTGNNNRLVPVWVKRTHKAD
ncbi:alginate biosynthesis protein AlgF [Betaproteobacteria bacterium]|nr:alginate biosynthesis protein AlgF [Betaproteobacteria bacterium]GHU03773.1 alginate biosynthesis protein AlgF [Betaproteobacteria bacterium]GHU21796.1 alginate biosynthesis protein AlgF [Betaproteobacteria bacterium]